MSIQPQPLPFDPEAIPGLSAKLLRSHHANNYTGAVKRLDAIRAELARLDPATAPGFAWSGLKRGELIATNSMLLHELYFDGMAASPQAMEPAWALALAANFGSAEGRQTEFSACGKAQAGGSGWRLLTFLPREGTLVNQWAADHTHAVAGDVPLLALDMYEHAYHMLPARRDGGLGSQRPARAADGVSERGDTMPKSRVALLYPGDRAARARSDPAESRFAPLFEAFATAGIAPVPAIYHDDFADEVEAQLRGVDVVLVWSNPVEGGRRRGRLDAMLRRISDAGAVVSAHPEAILKLGTKDVLFDTRDLPFGSDVHRVESLEQLATDLPRRLAGGARVLKQHRGQSGNGIWRVEQAGAGLRVRHAQRGAAEEAMDLPQLLQILAPYFEPANGGHMIDQAWQPRLVDGMLRAYLVEDRVAGFGVQAVNALFPAAPGEPAPQPGPRLYHGTDLPQGRHLKHLLETQWIEMLRTRVGLPRDRLPLLWDCDFLFGEAGADGSERFVLCEINVSSVAPFPPSAIAPLVSAVRSRLGC